MEECNKHRIILIDVMRISLVVIIFCFHACIHMNCTYGFMTKIFVNGNLAMSTFFIISGFSLFYTNNKRNMNSISEMKKFYIKRIIGIYPAYIAVVIFFLLFNNTLSLFRKSLLLPMDIMMLQSTVEGSFSTLHHGGTWFISCLFICYLLTPFFIEILKQLETKKIVKLGMVIYLICAYIPFIVKEFEYKSIYSNVFYRSLQFFLGGVIAAIHIKQDSEQTKKYKKISYVTLLLGIILLGIKWKSIPNVYTFNEQNDWLVILISSTLIYIISLIDFKRTCQKNKILKLIQYVNEISYEIFLGQFFCFNIMKKIIIRFPILNNNSYKIFFSAIICLAIAIGLHEVITKPCKKIFNKHVTKKHN